MIFLFRKNGKFYVSVTGTGLQVAFPEYHGEESWQARSEKIVEEFDKTGIEISIKPLGLRERIMHGDMQEAEYFVIYSSLQDQPLPPAISDMHNLRWLTVDKAEDALESQGDFLALRNAISSYL